MNDLLIKFRKYIQVKDKIEESCPFDNIHGVINHRLKRQADFLWWGEAFFIIVFISIVSHCIRTLLNSTDGFLYFSSSLVFFFCILSILIIFMFFLDNFEYKPKSFFMCLRSIKKTKFLKHKLERGDVFFESTLPKDLKNLMELEKAKIELEADLLQRDNLIKLYNKKELLNKKEIDELYVLVESLPDETTIDEKIRNKLSINFICNS